MTYFKRQQVQLLYGAFFRPRNWRLVFFGAVERVPPPLRRCLRRLSWGGVHSLLRGSGQSLQRAMSTLRRLRIEQRSLGPHLAGRRCDLLGLCGALAAAAARRRHWCGQDRRWQGSLGCSRRGGGWRWPRHAARGPGNSQRPLWCRPPLHHFGEGCFYCKGR